MNTKIVFYLKDNRTVTLTDDDNKYSMNELEQKLVEALSSDSFCSFTTERDKLILKPSSILGIHLQQMGRERYEFNNDYKKPPISKKIMDTEINLGEEFSKFDEEDGLEDEKTKEPDENLILDDDLDEADGDSFLSNFNIEETKEDFEIIEEKETIKEESDIPEKEEESELKKKKEPNVRNNKPKKATEVPQVQYTPNKTQSRPYQPEPSSVVTNSRESINMIISRDNSSGVSDNFTRSGNNPLDMISDPNLRKKLESGIRSGKIKDLKITPKAK